MYVPTVELEAPPLESWHVACSKSSFLYGPGSLEFGSLSYIRTSP